jgi:hypothetical protein
MGWMDDVERGESQDYCGGSEKLPSFASLRAALSESDWIDSFKGSAAPTNLVFRMICASVCSKLKKVDFRAQALGLEGVRSCRQTRWWIFQIPQNRTLELCNS